MSKIILKSKQTIVLLLLTIGSTGLLHAQKECSLTGLNGNCIYTVDRVNPITQPTIYVRHGAKVTVVVNHAFPFERLTVDPKSISESPHTDQIANGFSALTQTLGSITITGQPIGLTTPAAVQIAASLDARAVQVNKFKAEQLQQSGQQHCPTVASTLNADQIKECQTFIEYHLKSDSASVTAWTSKAVCMFHGLFIPIDSPLVNVRVTERAGGTQKVLEKLEAEVNSDKKSDLCQGQTVLFHAPADPRQMASWLEDFTTGFDAEDKAKHNIEEFTDPITGSLPVLDASIEASKASLSQDAYQTAKSEEDNIHSFVDSINNLVRIASALHVGVTNTDTAMASDTFVLSDPGPNARKNITPTWDLNAQNLFASVADKAKADKNSDDLALKIAKLTDGPVKQTIVEFSIQYMDEQRFEISSGIVVPIKSYNNYSVAISQTAATNTTGTCPSTPAACGVIINSPVTAIVPGAFLNYALKQSLTRSGSRFAILGSAFVGYNTARTSASLGAGPSISIGSLVINSPIVFDRDQRLGGGYTVGGSAGTATTPVTSNVWRWSPSIGISLRIPLGGSSK